jgi:hypothetical protein
MALKNIEGRNEEVEALKGIEGVDPGEIMRQITGEPIVDTPKIIDTKLPPQQITPPKQGEAGPPADATGILKEIFGDQFTSVDDLKKTNIPEKLKEAEQLRQRLEQLSTENKDLSSKLSVKPKSNFADDDVALYNEFVRETKIKSYDIFNKLNGSDLVNMDPKEAIILARLLEEPELIKMEPQLRKRVETTYNVDPEKIDEDEVEINKFKLAEDGIKAKRKLQEFKSKLKIPEPEAEKPTIPQWTPEQEKEITTQWSAANKAMGEKLSKIPIYLPVPKDSKEPAVPFINFAIPEEMQKAIMKEATSLAINDRLGIDENTLTKVAKYMYSELILRNLDGIAHSIFEKARSLSDKEVRERYHNPTPLTGGDNPPIQRGDITEEEESKKAIFDAEFNRG